MDRSDDRRSYKCFELTQPHCARTSSQHVNRYITHSGCLYGRPFLKLSLRKHYLILFFLFSRNQDTHMRLSWPLVTYLLLYWWLGITGENSHNIGKFLQAFAASENHICLLFNSNATHQLNIILSSVSVTSTGQLINVMYEQLYCMQWALFIFSVWLLVLVVFVRELMWPWK